LKITCNPFIPSVWKQTDVKKLLESIDLCVSSNQKMDEYLVEIAALSGVTKTLVTGLLKERLQQP